MSSKSEREIFLREAEALGEHVQSFLGRWVAPVVKSDGHEDVLNQMLQDLAEAQKAMLLKYQDSKPSNAVTMLLFGMFYVRVLNYMHQGVQTFRPEFPESGESG